MKRITLPVTAAIFGLTFYPAAACEAVGELSQAMPVTTAALQIVPAAAQASAELPSIASLTADSDYSVFMAPDVPASVRAAALRKLWRTNPIFSQSDGLDSDFRDHR